MTDAGKHEIVIIRRGRHSEHDEHHGGVWKIAFADFMTAMMAFFLVMWLISANDKTRASVARYFNPVRLVDATTQPRGLRDAKKDESGITASPDTKGKKGDSKDMKKEVAKATDGPIPDETPQGRIKRLDQAMRESPLAALAEIASSRGASDTPPQESVRSSLPVIGRQGGPAYRDPFAPQRPSPASMEASQPVDGPTKSKATVVEQPDETDAKHEAAATRKKAAADQLASSLRRAADSGGPNLAVQSTSEGLLFSLTDTEAFSMFANGSAVPAKRVVLMMERIAKVLGTKPGSVVIRGYTDNKKFHSKRYDNWNLSVDRAQAAHYMLLRGGLADARIAAVQGFADHGMKTGVDPASPLNRRIEILLQDERK